jgi:hypothetical protein
MGRNYHWHHVLTAYFLAAAALKAHEIDTSPKQESALLAAALSEKASVFALFGGQGTNFDGHQNLYDIYEPFIAISCDAYFHHRRLPSRRVPLAPSSKRQRQRPPSTLGTTTTTNKRGLETRYVFS